MRHAIRNFKIVDTFDELRAAKCDPVELEKNWAYPIAGDIGIYEDIETFTRLAAAEHPVEKEFFAFHDTLTFTTDIGGDVIPTLTLKPVTKQFRVTSASGNLTFAANVTTATIQIQVKGDRRLEHRERFFLSLTNPSAGAAIDDGQAVGGIRDDEIDDVLKIVYPSIKHVECRWVGTARSNAERIYLRKHIEWLTARMAVGSRSAKREIVSAGQ